MAGSADGATNTGMANGEGGEAKFTPISIGDDC